MAAEAAHAGQHVVLATGTASGKSLAYQLPGADRDPERPRRRAGSAARPTLYLAPDQGAGPGPARRRSPALGLDVRVTTHDGDSSREQRDWTRDHGEYVLTNPDMLHRSLLPGHAALGARSSASLDYVVVDECHHYRGVFGAHVAQVLRRLRRVCALVRRRPDVRARLGHRRRARGRTPHRLTGLDVMAVSRRRLAARRGRRSRCGSRRSRSYAGENGAPVRRAASSEAADLLADLVAEGVRTLAFVRSRRGAEQVRDDRRRRCSPRSTRRCPAGSRPTAAATCPRSAARSSRRCAAGELIGLAATNALELGIDISGLDAVLMAGFPGTRAALWQQVGRAGRGAGRTRSAVLVARDDPLDTYLVTHPEALLGRPVEATVFDPTNPYVARAAPVRRRAGGRR